MVEETFGTREEAQVAWTSAETQAAMEADGVDMSSVWFEYFDEVDSGKLPTRRAVGMAAIDALASALQPYLRQQTWLGGQERLSGRSARSSATEALTVTREKSVRT